MKERPALNLCVLVRELKRGKVLTLSRTGPEFGRLTFEDTWADVPRAIQDVEFGFDDGVFEGSQFENRFTLRARDNLSDAIADFRSSETLELRRNRNALYRIPLEGSAAALEELDRCAARYSGQPEVQFEPPPKGIAEPDLGDPFEPNQPLYPLNPELGFEGQYPSRAAGPIESETWIKPEDLRCSWHGCKDEGTVRFELKVSALGRVDGCKIVESRGHRILDQQTCRLLERRARFTPAKGPNGNPVESTYMSAVNWVIDHSPPAPIIKPGTGD